MSKRKLDEVLSDDWKDSKPKTEPIIKNSLDSDEEDDEAVEDNYNVMHEDDFEGKYLKKMISLSQKTDKILI